MDQLSIFKNKISLFLGLDFTSKIFRKHSILTIIFIWNILFSKDDRNNSARGKGRLQRRVCHRYARDRKRDSKQTRVRLPQPPSTVVARRRSGARVSEDRERAPRGAGSTSWQGVIT